MLRNGYNDRTIEYKGFNIVSRCTGRNKGDKTYSVIITEEFGEGYLIKKRYSGLDTLEKEIKAIEKAKKWIDQLK